MVAAATRDTVSGWSSMHALPPPFAATLVVVVAVHAVVVTSQLGLLVRLVASLPAVLVVGMDAVVPAAAVVVAMP